MPALRLDMVFVTGVGLADEFRAGVPVFRAAQRAFILAASLALPSGVNPPFFLGAVAGALDGAVAAPLIFAQRACWEARIRATVAADIVRLPFFAEDLDAALRINVAGEPPPMMPASSASRF